MGRRPISQSVKDGVVIDLENLDLGIADIAEKWGVSIGYVRYVGKEFGKDHLLKNRPRSARKPRINGDIRDGVAWDIEHSGFSQRAIATKWGISASTVGNIGRERGLLETPPADVSPHYRPWHGYGEEILDWYMKGESLAKIQHAYGITHWSLSKLRKDRGIPSRLERTQVMRNLDLYEREGARI